MIGFWVIGTGVLEVKDRDWDNNLAERRLSCCTVKQQGKSTVQPEQESVESVTSQ